MKAIEFLQTRLVNAFENTADILGLTNPKTLSEMGLETLRSEIRRMNKASRDSKIVMPIELVKMLPENNAQASQSVKVMMSIIQLDRYSHCREIPFTIRLATEAEFGEDLAKLEKAYQAEVSAQYARTKNAQSGANSAFEKASAFLTKGQNPENLKIENLRVLLSLINNDARRNELPILVVETDVELSGGAKQVQVMADKRPTIVLNVRTNSDTAFENDMDAIRVAYIEERDRVGIARSQQPLLTKHAQLL